MQNLYRVGFGLLAALFAVAAALQYNDDQALRWIAIYSVAALSCLAGAGDRPLPGLVLGLIASIAAVWASVLGVAFATGDVTAMYPETTTGTPVFFATKEGREIGGLLLIVAACGALFAYRRESYQ